MDHSNLPPGGGFYRGSEPVEQTCHKCKNKWDAGMYFELGGWFYDDDNEAFCPKCGHEDENGYGCATCEEMEEK